MAGEKRLFIVHGLMATPEDHWFQWLKEKAQALGMETFIPAMPDSDAPDNARWQAALAQSVGDVDGNTWFIGHSLGCISVLRYLSQRPEAQRAGGIVLVSGFSEPVPGLEMLDNFTRTPLANVEKLLRIPHRAVVASLNDEIVPPLYTARLSQQLKAPLYGLPDCGHFLDREGFTTLPLVADLLAQQLST